MALLLGRTLYPHEPLLQKALANFVHVWKPNDTDQADC